MLSTLVYTVAFVGLLLARLVLWALFLWFGLRWAKIAGVTKRRVVVTTAIVFVLQIAVDALCLVASVALDGQEIAIGLLNFAALMIVASFVIATAFGIPHVRAIQAWLPTLLAHFAMLGPLIFFVEPYLCEAYFAPTNAMAPTLLGEHWRGDCPECGGSTYCSPSLSRYAPTDPPLMICDNFHVTQSRDFETTLRSADHFLVAKFLKPRRWDLVVFQHPKVPSTLYVSRLVGLPGERIRIQDGCAWVDGQRQTPPESLRGIPYVTNLPGRPGLDVWGSPDRPALLGEDEYFVLSDFSARSEDSRLWQRGAPGHNPFAVPVSHIIGVVTHTHWPMDRWQVHR